MKKASPTKSVVLIVVGLAIGVIIGLSMQQKQVGYVTLPVNYSQETFSKATIDLVAVDDKGNGVAIPMTVEAKAGTGKILTDIDKILFWVDTQQSMQTAKAIAEKTTGINASNIDLVYTKESPNTTIVGGPSAGAALTMATISALENKKLRSDVMMTGTINDDGSIGEVGAVLQKAEAAKEVGAKTFLVPKGESSESYIIPIENCTQQIGFTYCITTYQQRTVNIGRDVGINVVEVGNVNDAMKYFFQ